MLRNRQELLEGSNQANRCRLLDLYDPAAVSLLRLRILAQCRILDCFWRELKVGRTLIMVAQGLWNGTVQSQPMITKCHRRGCFWGPRRDGRWWDGSLQDQRRDYVSRPVLRPAPQDRRKRARRHWIILLALAFQTTFRGLHD